MPVMSNKYWKWIVAGKVLRIYRMYAGNFESYKAGRWQQSPLLERALQDPSFVEIPKKEADVLIRYVGVRN